MPSNVQINTESGPKALANYPIKWSAIESKNTGFIIFGYVMSQYDEDTNDYYPAVRAYRESNTLWTKYFNGTSWMSLGSNDTFVKLE